MFALRLRSTISKAGRVSALVKDSLVGKQIGGSQQVLRLLSDSGSGKGDGRVGGDDAPDEHREWISFQKEISVEGFETGQEVEVKQTKKRRGGKAIRLRREKRLLKMGGEKEELVIGGGEFPPEVWSEEETERLLKEAFDNLPVREGKRGTKNLKRQKLRWQKKRMYDAKKKYERRLEHEQRMAKRSAIADACRSIRSSAETVRAAEKQYQENMYNDWARRIVSANAN